MIDEIKVYNASEHNLKNVSINIPKNKFVVFTGVSGSGKSSLAMDTIYAEGQRRYVESLSAYARQFLGVMGKPVVDRIEGLSPAIAIDQKTTSKNPRSTVGTVTEIYDFLRLLYARVGHPHCPNCGREISRQSTQQIVNQVLETVKMDANFKSVRGVRLLVLSPVVRDRKGEFSSLFENLVKQGITRAKIDGRLYDLNEDISLIKTNKHTIEALVSRHVINHKKLENEEDSKDIHMRLYEAVETALKLSNGNAVVSIVHDMDFDFSADPKDFEDHLFSENFACPVCNISLPDIEPRTFSFNSPHGACPKCDGLGTQLEINKEIILNPKLTIAEGGVLPWNRLFEHSTWTSKVIEAVADKYNFSINVPISELSEEALQILLYGIEERVKVDYVSREGSSGSYMARFEGVIPNLERRHKETKSDYIRNEIEKYMVLEPCPECLGTRLKKESLSVVINNKNISDVTDMSIEVLADWVNDLNKVFSEREKTIAETILKEINYRIRFLLDVGLSYLTLSRASGHLSGGEAQRIRLASQIGTGLSGVLYVLDEPSIGLHQRDQGKLIKTLKHLRDLGNTVIVVEHDTETMLESDYIFDFGPGAGEHGGNVVAFGTPDEIKKDENSITGQYLSGKKKVGEFHKKYIKNNGDLLEDLTPSQQKTREKISGENIVLTGASGHNLKNADLEIPLGKIVCVTGVSGSGKSTLVMDTFYRAIRQEFGLKNDERPLDYKLISGMENIDKVIAIDQTPIGRTPKSNPATYTKTFDQIRDLFAKTEEARIRGYKAGRFSFNVKGGRCEACGGEGQIKIEMQFMPDVYVNCEVCDGKRYNREALEIYYKGKNIADVLDMTVEEALKFFENIPQIRRRLKTIFDVGLGYIRLGQPAPTLSGGEAQRVKLALELSKVSTGSTLYILDEPTTGLHFADLERLISIVKRLSAKGNTVLIIEHNLDVIANSDWVVDLGPEGGDKGGEVVFSGPLGGLLKHKSSHTAQALREMQ